MYKFDDDIVANQLTLIIEYSNSVAFFDEVKDWDYSAQKDAPYWTHLSNMAINDSIIKWTKLFGTDENELHWKKSSVSAGYKDEVKSKIIGTFDSGENGWKAYHKEMINFRNTYSAHRNIKHYSNVPFTESGFKVAEVFFNFLVDQYPWNGHQPYLQELYDNHQALVRESIIQGA